jgi:hypothetical protein
VHSPDTTVRAIDLDRAARDPDELVRAALMPHRQVGELLGAHRFQGKTSLEVREGDAVDAVVIEQLEVVTTIEFDAGGTFHALSENSRDYGREVYHAGGFLYLAPRYSKFHRRQPETPDEPAQIRDDMYGELGAHLELVSRAIAVTEGGPADHAGRSARAVTVTRADQPRRPAARKAGQKTSPPAQRQWRDDAVVEAAQGEFVLDSDTGVVLRAAVRGTVRFTREDRTFSMTFAVDHAIDAIGQPATFTVPGEDRWVATPIRSREVDERDLLLRGIAPPARRSGQSAARPADGQRR